MRPSQSNPTEKPALRRLTRPVQLGLVAGAALFILAYLYIAVSRMLYPYELEWTEGRMVDHSIRIMQGKKLYVEPSLAFMPVGYTPLYYYLGALSGFLWGPRPAALRFVSLLSSLAIAAIVGWWVHRSSKSKSAAFLSACLFVACFHFCGGYYDTARADSLQICFLMGGLYCYFFCDSWKGLLPGTLLLSLSLMTKQTTLFPVAAACIALAIRSPLKGLAAGTLCGALVVVQFAILCALYGYWPLYYCIFNVASHPLREGQALDFWLRHLARYLPLASAIACWFVWRNLRKDFRRSGAFYALVAGAMLFSSWIGIWSVGGDRNNLIAAATVVSLGFGLGLGEVFAALEKSRPYVFLLTLCLLAGQFALLLYNPVYYIPTPADYAAGEELIDRMRRYPGEVWLAYHGYLPRLAGKRIHATANDYTVNDASRPNDLQAKLAREIRAAVELRRFDAIFFNGHELPEAWRAYYRFEESTFSMPDSFYPVVGYQTRPKAVFVPRRNSQPKTDAQGD